MHPSLQHSNKAFKYTLLVITSFDLGASLSRIVSQSPCVIYQWERRSKTKKYVRLNYRKCVFQQRLDFQKLTKRCTFFGTPCSIGSANNNKTSVDRDATTWQILINYWPRVRAVQENIQPRSYCIDRAIARSCNTARPRWDIFPYCPNGWGQ
jgi:hypothetical protein